MPSSFRDMIKQPTEALDELKVCVMFYYFITFNLFLKRVNLKIISIFCDQTCFQTLPGHDTMLIEEFDPDVFRQIIGASCVIENSYIGY